LCIEGYNSLLNLRFKFLKNERMKEFSTITTKIIL